MPDVLTTVVNALPWVALALGALMGLGGLVNPRWAANVVRLIPDPSFKGGLAEFRASFGGLFLFVHVAAAACLYFLPAAESAAPLYVVAGIWFGSAVGRTVSVLLDGTGTAYNYGSIVFELVMGLMLIAPSLLRSA